MREELSSVRAFGSDGEAALEKAFATTFSKAVHVRCFLHFHVNIEQKLWSLNLPITVASEIVKDVMGSPSSLTRGLVDAEDAAKLDLMLLKLMSKAVGMSWKSHTIHHHLFTMDL